MSDQRTHILVVEDDVNLRETLQDILSDLYRVSASDCISSAQRTVSQNTFDLIILDLMLPDGDGYSFCQKLRDEGFNAPILMLTARSLEDDLVKGFDAGADDYLVKPYRANELQARVKALLRRKGLELPAHATLANNDAQSFKIGEHIVSRTARSVTSGNSTIVDLTPKEFDLLIYLYDHPHQAISRYKLLEAVWDNTVIDERTVDNFVSSLKRKLNLSASNEANIETVRGVGYRFELK